MSEKIEERQHVTVQITTEGARCTMSDEEIKGWYEENIKKLFNPALGPLPDIKISLERELF